MNRDAQRLLSSIGNGIPLTGTPFRDIGVSLGKGEDEVIETLLALVDDGTIRRFGARIDHRKLGFLANAMVCWKVPENEVGRVGALLAANPGVTHCYERETIPGIWDYNLFCVMHGHSIEDVQQEIRKIREAAGLSEPVVLFSKRKFKHVPVAVTETEEIA